jgi:ketosteroid isomerase-like protein
MSVRDEVENLFFRYARAFDEDDLDTLATCFTEDAELFSFEWIHGRDAIRAALAARREMRAQQRQLPRHIHTNIAIEPRGEDELHVHSLFSLAITSAAGVVIEVTGTYDDTVVRRDGRWLIARRRITRDEIT